MIIETPYKANDTVTIKTFAGEELLGRFIEEDAATITIEKPMAIMASGQGIGLGPFTFTISPDAKIKLNKNGCLVIHKTDGEMAKQYVSNTSGIQMV
jgi:hypothetical protein